jgi:tetratricopeptide (TPR) repeat protein
MSLQKILKFFKDVALWRGVTAKVIGGIILAALGLLWWYFKPKPEPPAAPNITINVINYVDGLPRAENLEVRGLFAKATEYYNKREFGAAIREFTRCLEIEQDSEKRGALNLQIGNCYYQQQMYLKAAEIYAAGLREARKAKDLQGEASSLSSIANTYMLRPASSGKVRGDNVRKAVEYYSEALKVFNKDEYPVDYATTQNNLGSAYTYLPSATPEERARNIKEAIECYRAALEIYKKDEYPQYYCQTAANLGEILASINNPDACYWLKEAYTLREYLEGQGKRLEEHIRRVCKEEQE